MTEESECYKKKKMGSEGRENKKGGREIEERKRKRGGEEGYEACLNHERLS